MLSSATATTATAAAAAKAPSESKGSDAVDDDDGDDVPKSPVDEIQRVAATIRVDQSPSSTTATANNSYNYRRESDACSDAGTYVVERD